MPRIAIQLCGHMRSYKSTYKSLFTNCINPLRAAGYEVDIFIHTWSESDTSEKSWHNREGYKRGYKLSDKDIKEIKELYKPAKLLVEDQLIIDNDFEIIESLMSVPRQYSAIINSAYSKYRVNQLRKIYENENSIIYDWIIQTRPDLKFNTIFNIKNFIICYERYGLKPPENGLFVTSIPFRRGTIEPDIFLCSIDLIIFALPDVMNKINNFYIDLSSNKLTKEWCIKNSYSMEILYLFYWKMLNIELIKLKYFQFSDYDLIRDIKNYSQLPAIKDASIEKPEKIRRNLYRKFLRELLKILPYFLVHKKIDELNFKIIQDKRY